jgi:hypothetical protein
MRGHRAAPQNNNSRRKRMNNTNTAQHTPGPWEIDNETRPVEVCTIYGVPAHGEDGQQFLYVRGAIGDWNATEETNLANARLIAAAPELLAALHAYQAAQAMPIYGDSSDFVGGNITMREPGNSAWGWICDKHGLGYQSGCICCDDDRKRHSERKDREARYARDDAFRAAYHIASPAITKATGAA